MSNPFLNEKDSDINYSKFVRDQLIGLLVGDSIQAELVTKGKEGLFRGAVFRAGESLGQKFRTKTDSDGNTWVKRIK